MSSLSRRSSNGWQPGARTPTLADFAEVFWERVDKSGECWIWLGRVAGKGYGQITTKWFKTEIAHRIAYELEVGPIPAGMLVCHHCDTRLCMRPSHLFVGTDRDNVQDMLKKGRSIRIGEKNPAAKLNDSIVRQVKALNRAGWRQADIARRLHIRPQAVSAIVRDQTWKHVA